jgi:hypothetical protein
VHLFLERALKQPGEAGPSLSRRAVLSGGVAAAGAAVAACADTTDSEVSSAAHVRASADGRVESKLLFFDDPLQHQQAAYRILRNLYDDADVLFWYHFTMFSVVLGQRPEPVVRWEGIEFSHHRKIQHGVYRVHGHNLSFPRDLSTGDFIEVARNPVTGKTVAVPPMALTGDPGYLHAPEGVVPLDNPAATPRERQEQFLFEDDLIKIEQTRLPPASWPATFVETSVNWSPRRLFDDPKQLSLPAGTSGGYIFPWPEWMEMGDTPGHMFATWHGRKLESVAQLPREFIDRAEQIHPELLVVDQTMFDQPLPEPLASRFDSLD